MGFALFLAWPGPIDSRAFRAMPAPEGDSAPVRSLAGCVPISEGEIRHSDKLLVDASGNVYAGDEAGVIHRLRPVRPGAYERVELARIAGRPMQLAFAPSGALVVADHVGSHIEIQPDGTQRRLPTLTDVSEGTAGVAIASDGTLFYGAHLGEVLSADEQTAAFLGGLEAKGDSELRAFDPHTGRERTLATGLYRPVGVALADDESFVAVAEFFAYRVTRHWLSGPRAGTTDRLVANLPGFPDGIAAGSGGEFWISLAGPRSPAIDWLQGRPWLKNQVAKLLPILLRSGTGRAQGADLVVVVDRDGRILRSYRDAEQGRIHNVTAAEVHAGHLYLGSITADWIVRCPLESGLTSSRDH